MSITFEPSALEWVAALGPITAAVITGAIAIFALSNQRKSNDDALEQQREQAERAITASEAARRAEIVREREDARRARLREDYASVREALNVIEEALSAVTRVEDLPTALEDPTRLYTRRLATLPDQESTRHLWDTRRLIVAGHRLPWSGIRSGVAPVVYGAIGYSRDVVSAILREDEPPSPMPALVTFAQYARALESASEGESTRPEFEWPTYQQDVFPDGASAEGMHVLFSYWRRVGRPQWHADEPNGG